jgi:BirA family biotin operon repressor/biotin-[acetyl-CoA-carboxylase] ligase
LKVIKLNATASTNSYLKDLGAEISLEDGTIVWAATQSEGRGQHGNTWVSETGKSLTFSIFRRFKKLPPEDHIRINLAVSLGIVRSLAQLNIPKISVKWPNDILSYNKKICGILIENQIQGNTISGSVIGVGLNVNNSDFSGLPNAGSLYTATRKTYALETVLHQVASSISAELDRAEGVDLKVLIEDYHSRLFRKDSVSVFKLADGSFFNGIIRGVSREGHLCVETEDETIREFGTKEIEMCY